MNHQEALTAYIAAFIDELSRMNVKHAVISPGSRSTPISMLMASHPSIETHINIDERSAAFFALGLSKALQEPVALVCTSGTAAANYYPAIVEAKLSRVPLIIITADRPHELRDVGAPQTIDQLHLYGNHVKWFSEMAVPNGDSNSLIYVRNISRRAVMEAKKKPLGPVHLNMPIREPLIPNMKEDYFHVARYEGMLAEEFDRGELQASGTTLRVLEDELERKEKGIIICGELHDEAFTKEVIELAEKLKYPILADPLSLIRTSSASSHIIDCYDTFLKIEKLKDELKPDVIIRFGAMPVSKPLMLFMKECKAVVHIVVDSGSGWREPTGLPTTFINSEEATLCKQLSERIPSRDNSQWFSNWVETNQQTKQGLSALNDEVQLNEGKVFLELQHVTPDDCQIFVSNSMPIRDCDTFFHAHESERKIYANRGANGIDGIVSSAIGVSAVNKPTVLVIGDLSFFHDLNGLLAAKMQKRNITVIVINNDGGGIFSFLPQASEKEHFEELFGTPHGLDFSHAVKMYGGKFTRVRDWEHFRQAVASSFDKEGIKVIEVQTNREENVQSHRKLWNDVSREMNLSFVGETNAN